MALNIKNPTVEERIALLARQTGESKTEAVGRAVEERIERLGVRTPEQSAEDFQSWMDENVWSKIPIEERGRPMSKEEREEILGYGPNGVADHP